MCSIPGYHRITPTAIAAATAASITTTAALTFTTTATTVNSLTPSCSYGVDVFLALYAKAVEKGVTAQTTAGSSKQSRPPPVVQLTQLVVDFVRRGIRASDSLVVVAHICFQLQVRWDRNPRVRASILPVRESKSLAIVPLTIKILFNSY